MELIGLYLVACALLIVAGVAKAIRPDDTARALSSALPDFRRTTPRLALRRMRIVVRAGAAAEAALGVVALVIPRSAVAWLVVLSYFVLAGFVGYARAHGGAIASCGCFGKADTPATTVHLIINIGLGCSAAAVATAGPTGTIVSVLSRQPVHGVPLMAASALCAWLTYLAMARLAELRAARSLTAVSFERAR